MPSVSKRQGLAPLRCDEMFVEYNTGNFIYQHHHRRRDEPYDMF